MPDEEEYFEELSNDSKKKSQSMNIKSQHIITNTEKNKKINPFR